MMFDNELYSEKPPEFRREAWYGLMFRWYGVDKIGNITIFESGELPIPQKIFTDESAYRELDIFFRNLPQITVANTIDELKREKNAAGNPIDFTNWIYEASKGLFFFDEIDSIGIWHIYGYHLIVTPEIKIHFNSLPVRIQKLLEPFRFPIIFSDTKEIEVRNYFACD